MRFFVALSREDVAVLSQLARECCRRPTDQASWLLSQAIRRERERQARQEREPRREEAARAAS